MRFRSQYQLMLAGRGSGGEAGGGGWDGDEPRLGHLEPDALAALCRVLSAADRCHRPIPPDLDDWPSNPKTASPATLTAQL